MADKTKGPATPSPDAVLISQKMQLLGNLINAFLHDETGREDIAWFLHIFDPGEPGDEPGKPGRAMYIASCDRVEVVKALRGLLEHFESGMPDIPAKDIQ